MFQLVMVRGRRQVLIGFFPSAYRAEVVAGTLEWEAAWTPEVRYLMLEGLPVPAGPARRRAPRASSGTRRGRARKGHALDLSRGSLTVSVVDSVLTDDLDGAILEPSRLTRRIPVKQKVGTLLDAQLLHQAKAHAAQRHVPLNTVIEEALRAFLAPGTAASSAAPLMTQTEGTLALDPKTLAAILAEDVYETA